ncbi:MAG: preprotein translocase subunit SecG [Verrucomicrobiota bacterium]|jgi:preprotein translocase subunit SecG
MNFIYICLTVVMFLDCVLLVVLVLAQLPKKDAGAGMAFGGAATDALFGAGSGNVLTKITKYLAGIFFALALIMAVMASNKSKSAAALLEEELARKGATGISHTAAPPPAAATTPVSGGLLQLTNAAPLETPSAPAAAAPGQTPAPAAATNK